MRSRRFKIGFLAVLLALSLLAAAGCTSSARDPIAEAIANGQPVVTLNANGGLMGSSRTINYILPEKGSYMLKPGETYGNETVTNAARSGYTLLGWFRGEEADGEVTLGAEFDFDTEKVYEERLTLYAGWELTIKYTFKVVYGENNENSRQITPRSDGSFKRPGSRDITWSGHTLLGLYWDEELTQEVEFDERDYSVGKHTFDPENPEITVYTKWLDGVYTLVSTGRDMVGINSGTNLYLLNDVDLSGISTNLVDEYRGIIEGNGFTISNWSVARTTPRTETNFGLFTQLRGATIRNVTFENCTVTSPIFISGAMTDKNHYLGFLAGSADETTVLENVRLVNCTATYTQVQEPAGANLINKGDAVANAACSLNGVTVENVTVEVVREQTQA